MNAYLGINVDGTKAAIKSYSASVKGPFACVKIEITVSDPTYLGYLLEDLGRAKTAADRSRTERAGDDGVGGRKARKRQALTHEKTLALPYYRSEP